MRNVRSIETLLGFAIAGVIGATLGILIKLGFSASDVLPFVGAFAGAGFAALISIWGARVIENEKKRRDARQACEILKVVRGKVVGLSAVAAVGADFLAKKAAVEEEDWTFAQFQIDYALRPETGLTWEQRGLVSKALSSLNWLWDKKTGIPRPEGEFQRTMSIVQRDLDRAICALEAAQ